MKPRIKKYVAIGPESTGKSTLCLRLAQYYQTEWCPEFAREYLEKNGAGYSYENLLTIARGQLANEESHVSLLNKSRRQSLLFVDTDMHVMRVWCEYAFDNCHRLILDQIVERRYDGYFLCTPDLPWVKDSLREYPDQNIRDELFLYYKELLIARDVPWVCIEGDYEKRLSKAIGFVDGQL